MKAALAIVLAIVAIAASVAFFRMEPDTLEERVKAEHAKAGAAPSPRSSSASIVLSIDVAKASPIARAANPVVATTLSQEFQKARALKPLYDRLVAPGGDSTAEAKFILYKIMAGCARRTDLKKEDAPRKDTATRRRELEALIPLSDPDRSKRLALFDELMSRCEGFESITTTKTELDKLLADAARDGDPKARARLATPQPPEALGPMRLSLSDDRFQALQAAITSRDPEAILIAGTALSNSFDDAVLQVGPDHDILNGRASMEAWRLVACEYGLDCGPENAALRSACVFAGQCAAANIQDHTFFYGVSPYEAQLIDRYRQVFRAAVASNDWSGLQLSRQSNNSGSRFYFSSYP